MTDETSSVWTGAHNSAAGRLRPWIGYLGAAFLGAVLLLGAVTKVLDPRAFVELIRTEGLDFLLPAGVVAFVALALEVGLGTSLILGVRRLGVLVPAALLVVFFLFLTGRTYYRFSMGIVDDLAGCGCFGNFVERTPAESFWQDLGLMVPALVLAFLWRRGEGFPQLRVLAVTITTAALLLLAWKSPDLPLDNIATRLRPGVTVSGLCATSAETRLCLSSVAPDLEEGLHWVVIADLGAEDFEDQVPKLNQIADAGASLWVLSAGTIEEHRAFFWQWGPSFEIVEAPQTLLKPLYRKLPRSFEVVDGDIVATFDGIPDHWIPSPQGSVSLATDGGTTGR